MQRSQRIQLLPNHEAFVERFARACEADERVVAAFVGGSNVKGKADQFSDIDLTVVTTDAACEEFLNNRESFLRSLGELVFFEDFGIPDIAFFIFADGVEGELYFGNESRLDHVHSGPFHILVDKKNILAQAVFPEKEPDPSRQREELRRGIFGFWHEMSHFVTAMGRGKLWWARGQLEQLRAICVNLARLQNDFVDEGVGEEPYFKIEYSMQTEKLSPLETTFCPMERESMLLSAWVILQFYKETAAALSRIHGVPYPHQLEEVMLARLEKLSK
jgi:predicted nucleotidyltransferase